MSRSVEMNRVFSVVLMLALGPSSAVFANCPDDFSWLGLAAKWSKEGHSANDLEDLRSLVRDGRISEETARKVVDERETRPLSHLLGDQENYDSEQRAVINRIVDAFSKPMHGELRGKPKLIEVGNSTLAPRRRTHVLLQNSTGSENEDSLSIVMLDPQTRRAIASTEYDYDSRSETLKITWIGVYKPDRGQGYSDLFFNQMLLRHPKTKTIVTTFGGDNLKIYEAALSAGKSKQEALALTPAYKSRIKLGFIKMQVGVDEWGSPQLIAVRP